MHGTTDERHLNIVHPSRVTALPAQDYCATIGDSQWQGSQPPTFDSADKLERPVQHRAARPGHPFGRTRGRPPSAGKCHQSRQKLDMGARPSEAHPSTRVMVAPPRASSVEQQARCGWVLLTSGNLGAPQASERLGSVPLAATEHVREISGSSTDRGRVAAGVGSLLRRRACYRGCILRGQLGNPANERLCTSPLPFRLPTPPGQRNRRSVILLRGTHLKIVGSTASCIQRSEVLGSDIHSFSPHRAQFAMCLFVSLMISVEEQLLSFDAFDFCIVCAGFFSSSSRSEALRYDLSGLLRNFMRGASPGDGCHYPKDWSH